MEKYGEKDEISKYFGEIMTEMMIWEGKISQGPLETQAKIAIAEKLEMVYLSLLRLFDRKSPTIKTEEYHLQLEGKSINPKSPIQLMHNFESEWMNSFKNMKFLLRELITENKMEHESMKKGWDNIISLLIKVLIENNIVHHSSILKF